MLPPLMIIAEVGIASYTIGNVKHETYRYNCIWFSPKSYKFETTEVYEDHLKLIQRTGSVINIVGEKFGEKLNFKTVSLELGKKKSTLSYDDNSVNGSPNTTINALLSFLPPVLQFNGIEPYKSKHPLSDKSKVTRLIPTAAVRVIYFDPNNNVVSEILLPLETLEILEEISETKLVGIQKVIEKSGFLLVMSSGRKTIIKPKNIAHRCGHYFLRGFDYLANKLEEYELNASTKIKRILTPFLEEAPKFNILKDPESATSKFITQEITDLIRKAISANDHIRIKYLNRNDELSFRSVKNMILVTVKENGIDVMYMIGYCLLRLEKRTFRVDRIQSIQMLNIKYK